jgi:hypothetical protein
MPLGRPSLRDALALYGAIALAACDDEAPRAPRGPGGFQRAPGSVSADSAVLDAAVSDAAAPDAGAIDGEAGGAVSVARNDGVALIRVRARD